MRAVFFVFCFMRNNVWFFDILINRDSVWLLGGCCKHNKGFCFVEYCKKCNFGQKTKRENGKKNKHRQKTIQVSNFHNSAETDVSLTWRKQILIQKSRRLFFDGKTAVSSEKILNRTKYGLIFQKREKGFFF